MPTEPISAPETEGNQIRELNRILRLGSPALIGTDGKRVALPVAVFRLLKDIARNMELGRAVLLVPERQQLTTQRAADRFAIIGAAGELASEWEITGWELGAAIAAAERCFHDWLRRRGTAGSSDSREAIHQVQAFIEAHGASRFQDWRATEADRIINRAGFKRDIGGEVEYLVLPEAFRNEVCRGFNCQSVARELAHLGFLHHEEGRLTIKPRIPALGLTWVYCIREAIMEFDDAGSD